MVAQFLNPRQDRSMRTAGQEDGSVLQQGPALSALRAAHNLGGADEDVTSGEVLEAKRPGKNLFSRRDVDAGCDPELAEGGGDDRMHALEPRLARVPWKTSR